MAQGRLDGVGQGSGRASGRAIGEIARARDIRFRAGQALLAGLLLAAGGIVVKAGLNEATGSETGDIVLMAAVVLAAWFGGAIGGVAATLGALLLNSLVFLGGDLLEEQRVTQVRQVLYLVTAMGTALVIASRRAARDRLADALKEVAALAEEVEARDARLELILAASRTGFWEWDMVTDELTWSDAIFRQHGVSDRPSAPPFADVRRDDPPGRSPGLQRCHRCGRQDRRTARPGLPDPVAGRLAPLDPRGRPGVPR